MKSNLGKSTPTPALSRRGVLKASAALAGTLAMPGLLRAQAAPTLRIGYWPVAAALPFFVAIEKGYFKEAGVNVEVQKYAGAQQIVEAMISGRCDGCVNGTGSANLAIGQIAQPDLLKFFCSNPTNAQYVLDEVMVPAKSGFKTIADLSGKTVAAGPGIQNMTLGRLVFERGGAKNFNLVELPFPQQVPAIAADQIAAAYTLEPQGTIGHLNGTTRLLEAGVISKYVLGDPMAPWHGGAAGLSTDSIRKNPEAARQYIAAYRRGVDLVRKAPDSARPFLKGYTAIEGPLTAEVPMSDYTMFDEFTAPSLAYFQKFYDVFTEKGVFERKVPVESLLYKG